MLLRLWSDEFLSWVAQFWCQFWLIICFCGYQSYSLKHGCCNPSIKKESFTVDIQNCSYSFVFLLLCPVCLLVLCEYLRIPACYHWVWILPHYHLFFFRQDYLCNNCKRPGHFGRDCPNVTVCNNCGLPGWDEYLFILNVVMFSHLWESILLILDLCCDDSCCFVLIILFFSSFLFLKIGWLLGWIPSFKSKFDLSAF